MGCTHLLASKGFQLYAYQSAGLLGLDRVAKAMQKSPSRQRQGRTPTKIGSQAGTRYREDFAITAACQSIDVESGTRDSSKGRLVQNINVSLILTVQRTALTD